MTDYYYTYNEHTGMFKRYDLDDMQGVIKAYPYCKYRISYLNWRNNYYPDMDSYDYIRSEVGEVPVPIKEYGKVYVEAKARQQRMALLKELS